MAMATNTIPGGNSCHRHMMELQLELELNVAANFNKGRMLQTHKQNIACGGFLLGLNFKFIGGHFHQLVLMLKTCTSSVLENKAYKFCLK